MKVNPRSAGAIRGFSKSRYRTKFVAKDCPWTHLGPKNSSRIKKEVPDYEEGKDYTLNELSLITEKILLLDEKPPTEHPMWLNGGMHGERLKREIYNTSGVPDPSIVSGIYWRTHPQGRKVVPDEQRAANGSSYYR